MADTAPGPVAAWRAEVRERAAATKASAHGYVPRGEELPAGPAGEWLIANLAAAADVPALLGALEAVLKLAGDWEKTAGRWAYLDECGEELRKRLSAALFLPVKP